MDTAIFVNPSPIPELLVQSPLVDVDGVLLTQDQLVAAWNLSRKQYEDALELIGEAAECERPTCANMATAYVDKTWQCLNHIAKAHSDYTDALEGDLS